MHREDPCYDLYSNEFLGRVIWLFRSTCLARVTGCALAVSRSYYNSSCRYLFGLVAAQVTLLELRRMRFGNAHDCSLP
jgi:hypothetical protein